MSRYENLVTEHTVDEIKERVREEDLDPAKVLRAEEANENRKTLTEWLEHRVVAEAEEPRPYPDLVADWIDDWRMVFVTGVVLGGLAVAVVFSTSLAPIIDGNTDVGDTSLPGDLSPQTAGERVTTYVQENQAALRLPPDATIEAADVSPYKDTDMYQVTLTITAQAQNQTIDQDVPVIVTRDGQYLFFSEPLDTTQSIQEQFAQQTAPGR